MPKTGIAYKDCGDCEVDLGAERDVPCSLAEEED